MLSRPEGWPTGETRLAGVIGDPIRHSLSPVIVNAAFAALGMDWVYLAFPVAAGQAAAALSGARALGVEGLSVTMPHKEAVAEAVDRLSPTAQRLGAVNVVVRDGEGLVGHSTDGGGFLDALRADLAFDPAGRRCVVVGAGGAARAVVLALAESGAADVAVLGRTPARVAAAAVLAGPTGRAGQDGDVAGADLVVNATPVGMGRDGGLAVAPELLAAGQLVVDLVYHPTLTPLMAAARERGATAVNGVGMLVHQAARAFRLWTGREAPVGAMAAAALTALDTGRGQGG